MLFRLFLRKEYTLRVFELVCQYPDLSFFACDSAITIGMIPPLLQSLWKVEYLQHAVFRFAKILSHDVRQLSPNIRDSTRRSTMSSGTKTMTTKQCASSSSSAGSSPPRTPSTEHRHTPLTNTSLPFWALITRPFLYGALYLKTITDYVAQKLIVYVMLNVSR